jgi:DNA-binding NarL/FixJ family response regulator
MNRCTVFICDAEPAAVAGLRWFLSEHSEFEVIGVASTEAMAVHQVEEQKPDLLILDHALGTRAATHLVSELLLARPGMAILLWTREVADLELVRALQAGVRGYVRKSSALMTLLDAMRQLKAGQSYFEESYAHVLRQWTVTRQSPRLTPREREVILLVTQGLKNREIAERLRITPGTVKVHLMHVFEKTGARDRYELAVGGSRFLADPVAPATKTA